MQRVCAWGRSVKVSLSVYRISQVPGRARARLESWDARCLSGALSWSLCSLSWPPGSGVSYLINRLPPSSGGWSSYMRGFCYWVWSLWCTEAGRPQQIAGTWWFTWRCFLRLPHMFEPIMTDVFNHWFAQGAISGRFAEERWQACLGGPRLLRAHNFA